LQQSAGVFLDEFQRCRHPGGTLPSDVVEVAGFEDPPDGITNVLGECFGGRVVQAFGQKASIAFYCRGGFQNRKRCLSALLIYSK
jgi:hypothetical protein